MFDVINNCARQVLTIVYSYISSYVRIIFFNLKIIYFSAKIFIVLYFFNWFPKHSFNINCDILFLSCLAKRYATLRFLINCSPFNNLSFCWFMIINRIGSVVYFLYYLSQAENKFLAN